MARGNGNRIAAEFIIIFVLFAAVVLHATRASAQDVHVDVECFPVATLKISFQVVFPNAKQVTMDGDAARAYLREYNSFGRPTEFEGDTLFMNILPNGTTMMIPLDENGMGCNRMIVGPKLHKVIMTKVARGAV